MSSISPSLLDSIHKVYFLAKDYDSISEITDPNNYRLGVTKSAYCLEITFFHWHSSVFEKVQYSCINIFVFKFFGSSIISTFSGLMYCSCLASLCLICIVVDSKPSLTLDVTFLLISSLSSPFISLISCFCSLIDLSYFPSVCLWYLNSFIKSDQLLGVVANFPISR